MGELGIILSLMALINSESINIPSLVLWLVGVG